MKGAGTKGQQRQAKTERSPESSSGTGTGTRASTAAGTSGKPGQGSCNCGSSKIPRNPRTALRLACNLCAHSGGSDETTRFFGGPRNNGASSEPTLTRPRRPGVVATSRRRGGHTGADRATREPWCQPPSGPCSRNDPGRSPRQQGHRAATAALPMAHGLPRDPARHPYSVRQKNKHPPPFLGEQHKRSGEEWCPCSEPPEETNTFRFPSPFPFLFVSGLELAKFQFPRSEIWRREELRVEQGLAKCKARKAD